jgi:hypothetical protein
MMFYFLNSLVVFSVLYLSYSVYLNYQYSKVYTWDKKNTFFERLGTALLQPFMDVFANKKTTHFWSWKEIQLHTDIVKLSHCKPLEVKCDVKYRHFNAGIRSIITGAFVDVNPRQPCVIIRPKTYKNNWKLAFATNNEGLMQIPKFSHVGVIKIVLDGDGHLFGLDMNNNFIELEIVSYCRADQQKDVLFV